MRGTMRGTMNGTMRRCTDGVAAPPCVTLGASTIPKLEIRVAYAGKFWYNGGAGRIVARNQAPA